MFDYCFNFKAKVTFDFLLETKQQVELKFTWIMNGEQFVMTDGILQMLLSCAANLVIRELLMCSVQTSTELEKDLFTLMRQLAMATKLLFGNVRTPGNMIAHTRKMLASAVHHLVRDGHCLYLKLPIWLPKVTKYCSLTIPCRELLGEGFLVKQLIGLILINLYLRENKNMPLQSIVSSK